MITIVPIGGRPRAARRGRWVPAMVIALATAGVFAGASAGASGRAFAAAASPAAEDPGRELSRRLARSGSGEARFERVTADALSGRDVRVRGRIVLEPPDRVLLRFESTGERLSLRGDGGEWLQPSLRQMIVLTAAQAGAARAWWAVLAGAAPEGITIRPDGAHRFVLRSGEAAGTTARLTLDRAGLPASLDLDEDGSRSAYRFSAWTFAAARGRSAFVQKAPSGFEVVRLP